MSKTCKPLITVWYTNGENTSVIENLDEAEIPHATLKELKRNKVAPGFDIISVANIRADTTYPKKLTIFN